MAYLFDSEADGSDRDDGAGGCGDGYGYDVDKILAVAVALALVLIASKIITTTTHTSTVIRPSSHVLLSLASPHLCKLRELNRSGGAPEMVQLQILPRHGNPYENS